MGNLQRAAGTAEPVRRVYVLWPTCACGISFLTCANQCDRAVPTCGQCCRTGQKCPGYRDQSTLIFRNETTRTINRARARAQTREASASSSQSSASPRLQRQATPSVPSTGPSTTTTTPPQFDYPIDWDNVVNDGVLETINGETVAPTIHATSSVAFSSQVAPGFMQTHTESRELVLDLSVKHFLENYVIQPSGPSPGFLDYAPAVLESSSGDISPVQAAVQAVGLASLARTLKDPSLVQEAQANYVDAIQKIRVALVCPGASNQDATILTILVLGLYETIVCANDDFLTAWTCHVDGAADLLVHRGIDQFKTDRGLHIFQEALSHLLASCSRLSRPIPPQIRLLRLRAAPFIPSDNIAWALSSNHIEVLDVLHDVNLERTEPHLQSSWDRLLLRACEIDGRLELLFERLTRDWQYKTVQDPNADPSLVYQTKFHIYYDIWIAKIWVGMRSCRIFLNLIIARLLQRECSKWAPLELEEGGAYADLPQKMIGAIRQMRDDILASVPQMLGYVHHDTSTSAFFYPRNDGAHSSSMTQCSVLGAYFLLWHLYLAGAFSINTNKTRCWIIECLRNISNTTGMQTAQHLANDLSREEPGLLGINYLNAFEMLSPDN